MLELSIDEMLKSVIFLSLDTSDFLRLSFAAREVDKVR